MASGGANRAERGARSTRSAPPRHSVDVALARTSLSMLSCAGIGCDGSEAKSTGITMSLILRAPRHAFIWERLVARPEARLNGPAAQIARFLGRENSRDGLGECNASPRWALRRASRKSDGQLKLDWR